MRVSGIEIDPYDIQVIVEKINTELVKIPGLLSQPLVFNLTGGTKPMSLAGYQVAMQHSATNYIFINTK